MKSNNYNQVKTDTLSTNATIVGETISTKQKVSDGLKNIIPYLKGIGFGLWIIFIGVGVGLFFHALALSAKCDGYGDRLGYASDVRKGECHLKINGEWKPLDSLTLLVKNGS